MIVPYTSAIPNKDCLKNLSSDWRLLLSPASVRSVTQKNKHILYQRGYAIDNGAYSWHIKGQPFNDKVFLKLLNQYAKNADWIVIPDCVGDYWETARMFMIWYQKLIRYRKKLLYVAQNGIEDRDYATIRGMTSRGIGIFVGGSTDWKLEHSRKIADICRMNGEICHIGRVNSAKRLRLCRDWKATSFDGSGMARYRETARIMNNEYQQLRLF